MISRLIRATLRRLVPSRSHTEHYGRIGEAVDIHATTYCDFPGRVSVGNYVHVGPNCQLFARGGLTIEDAVIIAPQVVVLTSLHNYKDASMIPYDNIEQLRAVRIGRCTWIGIRAIVLPGVELGEGVVVGAGAVVSRSFEAGAIVAGNPAVQVGQRSMDTYNRHVAEGRFYLKLKKALGLRKVEVRCEREGRELAAPSQADLQAIVE